MQYLLYNPISGNGACRVRAEAYMEKCESECNIVDITEIDSYRTLFNLLDEDDKVILFGGDGTINRFINDTDGLNIKNEIYYFPAGTGNDFAADVDMKDATEPFLLNEYIKDLPTVIIDGKESKFINGIGYGIDGYCCEVGDKLRAENKKVDYTAIAIKGLLFHFKPVNATVTVDGVTKEFKKVWIAPTMHGRRYGGGMIPTPEQKRNDPEGYLSLMVFHGSSSVKTLMIFPSIFKGEHVKETKYVEVIKGKDIEVSFDRPTALQIDGETVVGVNSYRAVSHSLKKETEPKEAQV